MKLTCLLGHELVFHSESLDTARSKLIPHPTRRDLLISVIDRKKVCVDCGKEVMVRYADLVKDNKDYSNV